MNVLITSVGRRVELLRAFRAAHRELEVTGGIVGVDADRLAPALREVDSRYVVPRIADPKYVSTLAKICRRERIDLIFPLLDEEIPVVVAGRAELEGTGARLVVVPDDAATVAADKLLTNQMFQRIGAPAPRTWLPDEAPAKSLTYPVFVKPRFGSAGNGCYRVRDERELSFFVDYVPEPIVQEFLPGPEITNDVICDLDGNVLAVVSRRRLQVRAGEVAKGVTIYDPEITEHCVRIAKGLNAIGPLNVQCLFRDGKPYFTEVNPRFGGGVPLAIAAGADAPLWLLAAASGRSIEIPPIGFYQTGLHMTRFDDSFFLSEEEVRGVGTIENIVD